MRMDFIVKLAPHHLHLAKSVTTAQTRPKDFLVHQVLQYIITSSSVYYLHSSSGTYCPQNSSSPTPCPAGHYCINMTDMPIKCPLGTYEVDGAAQTSFEDTCVTCPPGTFGGQEDRKVRCSQRC